MESLRVSNKKPLLSGYEENYYRVIFTLFGLAFLFSYYYSGNGITPLREFLVPRHLFAILPILLAAITYFSKWIRDHIKDIGSGYFLVCSLYLIGFLTLNGFHTHYEIGIITLVLISNLHLNKVLYIVLYNVIVLTALEFVFITASPDANIQPVLFFIFLLLVMLLCIFYQLYRIRYYDRQNENERLLSGLISGNPDAWMIFEAPGMVAIDAGSNSLNLFGINGNTALDQVSLRSLIAAGTANESDNIIRNILSGTVTGIKTQCRKQNGELFWTDISAFRIPGKPNYVYCRFLDISENKWSQENATENAIRYRSYLDNISEGIVICDEEETVRMINKTALLMLGINPTAHMAGKQLAELMDEETVPLIRDAVDKLTVVQDPGREKSKITVTTGKVIFTLISITDILENTAEILIRINYPESLKLADSIIKPPVSGKETATSGDVLPLHNTALPVAMTGPGKFINDCNEAFTMLSGYTRKELGGLTMENLVHPEDLPVFRAYIQNKTQNSSTTPLVMKIISKNGKTCFVHCYSTIMQLPSGAMSTFFILHDITQHKKTEAELSEAGSNVTAVIENSDSPIFSIDFNYRITVMNSAFLTEIAKRAGKKPSKGDDFRQYLENGVKDKWEATIRQVMKGKKIIDDETVEYPDKSTDYFETSYFPISTDTGLIIGVSVLSRKVTERILIEKELLKAKEQAEAATAAKSDFLATMSHEIRTPLNGLLGMTDLLGNTPLNNNQQEFVDAIKLSGEALLSVINDVLDYSKIESGKMELDERPFELKACISETFDILRYKANEKANRLSYKIDNRLPPVVTGDKARLRQILVNLVGNAIKFTEKGTIDVDVSLVNASQGLTEIQFAIKDTGIGMTQEQIGRLFKSFAQADSSTFGKYGGSGLGLTISQRLTTLMNGNIWVESHYGSGSTFYFTIKAKAANEIQLERFQTHESISNAVPVQEFRDSDTALNYPVKIMVAEDNQVNQMLAKKLFQKLGYEPTMVSNGKEAVAMNAKEAFDIIFMDIQMPGMNGFEATAAIRKQQSGKHQPLIIAMTALVMEGDREKCLNAGMDDYVSKPIQAQSLKNIITKRGIRKTPGKVPGKVHSESELVDYKIIARLISMAEDDTIFLQNLLTLFTSQSNEIIEEIYRLSVSGDFIALGQAAHKLKGSSLNVGARIIAELCKNIEEAAIAKDKITVDVQLKNLREIYQESLVAIKNATGIT